MTAPQLVRRYHPPAPGERPVSLPPEPWAMQHAEPLHKAPPPPATPGQSELLRRNLDLCCRVVIGASKPISSAGVARVAKLNPSYVTQLVRQLHEAGRIRRIKQGHLSFWGPPA